MAGWGVNSNAMMVMRVFDIVEKRAIQECQKVTRTLVAKILRNAKEIIKTEAYQTGALMRSGRIKSVSTVGKEMWKFLITFGGKGTGVTYAVFQEMGTDKIVGKHYLLRAVRANSPQLTKFNSKAIQQVWNQEVKKSNLVAMRLVGSRRVM